MRISKTGKIFLGVLTIGQLFLSLLIIVWIFAAFLPVFTEISQTNVENAMIGTIGNFLIFGIVLTAISVGLLIFYMIHAGTNIHISTSMRVVWIVLLLVVGAIVQVVYFFMEIVPEKSLTAKLEGSE